MNTISEDEKGAPIPFLDLAGVNSRFLKQIDTAWKDIIAHGKHIAGPEVEQFERQFAAYCRAEHCVGVANGTDALELILRALGIGRGDEVIVPANTFVATAEAVCAVGARPRFVDVLPDTLLLDPNAVNEAVTASTAAIIMVHLYGQMVDVEPILRVARRHGLATIEDAAQAHGAEFDGRKAGSVAAAAAFSFYPAKNLGAFADAGAVVSNDGSLIDRVRSLANHGRTSTDWHRHELRGRNSRLSSLQAAVLSLKLGLLDSDNGLRAAAMSRYREKLPLTCIPVAANSRATPVYHLAVVQVTDRTRATRSLDNAGIGWGVHYPVPCHLQPAFAEYTGKLPVAENASRHILSLPMSPVLSEDQIDRVCAVLHRAGI